MNVRLVRAFSLFHTDLFRKAPKIRALCRRLGFVWVTKDPEQPGHFGALFGAVRDPDDAQYRNKYVRDLRILHDLSHEEYWRLEHPHLATDEWVDWTRRMIDAEKYASLVSECHVYFWIPGLRRKTFKHEIWVDRFLKARGKDLRFGTMDAVRIANAREAAVQSRTSSDPIERHMADYFFQNHQWAQIWAQPVGYGSEPEKAAWRVLEEHMAPVRAGRKTPAQHRAWIDALSRDGGREVMPFFRQADAFQPVYEETVRRSGNKCLAS